MPRLQQGSRRNQNNTTTTTTGTRQQQQRQRKIHNVNPTDIICTKASRAVENHPGTLLYNTVIDEYASQYSSCNNANEKKLLTKRVIDTLQNEHGSRFIEPKNVSTTTNNDSNNDDDNNDGDKAPYYVKVLPPKIHEKVSHALRIRSKSISERSSVQQQQRGESNNVVPNTLPLSRAFATGGDTTTTTRTTEPLYATELPNMLLERSELLAPSSSSSRNLDDINNINDILHHTTGGQDDTAAINFNLSDIDDSSYTTNQYESDVKHYAFVAVCVRTPSSVLSSSASNNQHTDDRPDAVISNDNPDEVISNVRPDEVTSNNSRNNNTNNRTSRRRRVGQRNNQSSSTSGLALVKEEDDDDDNENNIINNNNNDNNDEEVIVFEDRNKIARRNRYFYHRRIKLKEEKQREYDQATPEERAEIDRQKIIRRNRYYYHYRLKLKQEKQERQQGGIVL